MKFPLQRELDDLFSSDQSILLKLLGGAAVGAGLSLWAMMRDERGGSPTISMPVKVAVVAGAAVVGAVVVLLLTLRDVVVRRVEKGKRVNPLLRAYFGKGNGCLMVFLWSVTIIFVTMVVTITLLTVKL